MNIFWIGAVFGISLCCFVDYLISDSKQEPVELFLAMMTGLAVASILHFFVFQ